MGGQHQRFDRPRRQDEVETAGFKVMGGAQRHYGIDDDDDDGIKSSLLVQLSY